MSEATPAPQPENIWHEPDYARALGLVKGAQAGGMPAKDYQFFLEHATGSAETKLSQMTLLEVTTVSRMVEGYVDARGLLR